MTEVDVEAALHTDLDEDGDEAGEENQDSAGPGFLLETVKQQENKICEL